MKVKSDWVIGVVLAAVLGLGLLLLSGYIKQFELKKERPASPTKIKTIMIATDSSWKSLDAEIDGWTSIDFDDSGWPSAEELFPIGGFGNAIAIWYPELPRPYMVCFRKIFEIDSDRIITGRIIVRVYSYNAAVDNFVHIFINNGRVGSIRGGWTAFGGGREQEFDIAPFLSPGQNIIGVKADFNRRAGRDWWWALIGIIKYE